MPLDVKKCTKCGEIKALDAFTRAKWMKDGRYPSCKACKSQGQRDRKEKDPEYYAAKQAQYDKTYAAKHPEELAERSRRWRAENPEKLRATAKKWAERNREKVRLYVRMANAKRRAGGGRNSHLLAKKMMSDQQGKCPVCKASLKNGFHIDHIVPIKLGGTNERTNLQLLCPPCNLSKKAKHPVDFMQSRGFLI